MSEALQHSVEGRPEHAAALLSLGLQSVHQAALDSGDWTSAWMILPCADPLARPTFGGSEQQMADIAQYRKALRELKVKHSAKAAEEELDEEGAPQEGNRRPRTCGDNKKKGAGKGADK